MFTSWCNSPRDHSGPNLPKNKLHKLFQGHVCQTHRHQRHWHNYNIYYLGYYSGLWLERPGYVWPSEGLSSPLALVCLSLALAFLPTDGQKEEFQGKCQQHQQSDAKTEGKKEQEQEGFWGTEANRMNEVICVIIQSVLWEKSSFKSIAHHSNYRHHFSQTINANSHLTCELRKPQPLFQQELSRASHTNNSIMHHQSSLLKVGEKKVSKLDPVEQVEITSATIKKICFIWQVENLLICGLACTNKPNLTALLPALMCFQH